MPRSFWVFLASLAVIGFLYWLEWQCCPMPDEEAWRARKRAERDARRGRTYRGRADE
jgi:hypothetical protein